MSLFMLIEQRQKRALSSRSQPPSIEAMVSGQTARERDQRRGHAIPNMVLTTRDEKLLNFGDRCTTCGNTCRRAANQSRMSRIASEACTKLFKCISPEVLLSSEHTKRTSARDSLEQRGRVPRIETSTVVKIQRACTNVFKDPVPTDSLHKKTQNSARCKEAPCNMN